MLLGVIWYCLLCRVLLSSAKSKVFPFKGRLSHHQIQRWKYGRWRIFKLDFQTLKLDTRDFFFTFVTSCFITTFFSDRVRPGQPLQDMKLYLAQPWRTNKVHSSPSLLKWMLFMALTLANKIIKHNSGDICDIVCKLFKTYPFLRSFQVKSIE